MGCHSEYCRLCGCAVGSGCVTLESDGKLDDKPGEGSYIYDSYGRIINTTTEEKLFCRADCLEEHVIVHRACWEICDKPESKNIRRPINVPEFRATEAQNQDFYVDAFLKRYPKLKFFLADPRLNRDNYNRIRFTFYLQKFNK